jgi:hypothetical protein
VEGWEGLFGVRSMMIGSDDMGVLFQEKAIGRRMGNAKCKMNDKQQCKTKDERRPVERQGFVYPPLPI